MAYGFGNVINYLGYEKVPNFLIWRLKMSISIEDGPLHTAACSFMTSARSRPKTFVLSSRRFVEEPSFGSSFVEGGVVAS